MATSVGAVVSPWAAGFGLGVGGIVPVGSSASVADTLGEGAGLRADEPGPGPKSSSVYPLAGARGASSTSF